MAITVVAPQSKTKPFTQKTVYYTLNFFFVLLLFSGYLPVQGLFASPIHLKFKYFSREFFYSLYIIVVACIMHFLRLYHYFTIKNDKITLRELIFMCTAFLSLVFFLQLARKWPRLIQKWCHLDEKFNVTYSYPKYLKLQLTLVTSIYLLIVFGEYFYFMSVKLDGSENTFQKVVEKIYFYIFAHIPYNIAVVLVIVVEDLSIFGIKLLTGCFQLPIFSNFIALSLIDVFVILVSITITFRFQQINELLKEQKNKNNSINFWMTVRRNYSEIGRLVSEINDTISSITVLSYGSNMILLINDNVVVEESKCFYVYSFLVLIIRLLSVYYFSSRINAESRKPIRILFDVSSEIYNVEIKRWFMQMKLDSVALTGSTFFRITPGLILSIAGAVVTYELIFIQFSQPK
nr:PREDICTED: gustatory receptor for sugar taste 64e isoform X2 [Tribolium castaneum]|eukprot:XP_015835646.1 PREDICTED: gustatory receptor for sugar taste 64e isoform X2 [Tribolium castaneum]